MKVKKKKTAIGMLKLSNLLIVMFSTVSDVLDGAFEGMLIDTTIIFVFDLIELITY